MLYAMRSIKNHTRFERHPAHNAIGMSRLICHIFSICTPLAMQTSKRFNIVRSFTDSYYGWHSGSFWLHPLLAFGVWANFLDFWRFVVSSYHRTSLCFYDHFSELVFRPRHLHLTRYFSSFMFFIKHCCIFFASRFSSWLQFIRNGRTFVRVIFKTSEFN